MRNGILWMLHRVAPPRIEHLPFGMDSALRLSPEYLEIQIIRAKEQGARFVSIDEFIENKHKKTSRPTDVCITIDDGTKDIYDHAFPVFKRQNVPFVFYVASDFIENGFKNCMKPEADGMQIMMDIIAKNDSLPFEGRTVFAATVPEKQAAFSVFWQAFIKQKEMMPQKSGYEILQELFTNELIDFSAYKQRFLCSWDDLKDMAQNPLCTIGSHAKTHQWLTLIKNDEDLENEFSQSKRLIENHIGKTVSHFSYPYGQYNDRVLKFARKYYRSAVSIRAKGKSDRRFTLSSDSDYILPRISVQENAFLPAYLGTMSLSRTYTFSEYVRHLFGKVFNFERKGKKRILTLFFIKIKFKVKKEGA